MVIAFDLALPWWRRPSHHCMRLAAIDIGTNSVHMIIVNVRPDLSFDVIDQEKVMVRLGTGGLETRLLTDEAMTAALQALAKFRLLADRHGVDEVLAAATSAVREARNGGDFLGRIAETTGIRARVISGAEEARLIHLAAVYGVDVGSARAVVIDIGGGSVEITHGSATAIRASKSFKLGAIRLTERFIRTDPLSDRDEQKLVKHIRGEIDRYCAQIKRAGFDRVIGTSGTILSLGAVAMSVATGTPPDDIRNLRVPARQIRDVRKRMVGATLRERLGVPGLDPRRADLAVAGSVLFDTILTRLGAEDVTLCDLALREGILLDYIRSHQRQIAKADRIPDIRRRSTLALAERCNYQAVHARQVVRLALSLYDQTRAIHGLTGRSREWLEFAAVMHDIGTHISYPRHHLHSYYLIKNGDLRGFDPEEIEIVGLIARYHRRGAPKRSHENYARLSKTNRQAVRTLASILRIAESLERSHAQAVAAIEVRDRGTDVLLVVRTAEDAELEVWAAERHLKPFERVLGKPVCLEAVAASARRPRRTRPTTKTRRTTRA
jgi:exopolyphosphatase / guanosine-5'-triphosphate,3'-diphosphate pyrophosphatase